MRPARRAFTLMRRAVRSLKPQPTTTRAARASSTKAKWAVSS